MKMNEDGNLGYHVDNSDRVVGYHAGKRITIASLQHSSIVHGSCDSTGDLERETTTIMKRLLS